MGDSFGLLGDAGVGLDVIAADVMFYWWCSLLVDRLEAIPPLPV